VIVADHGMARLEPNAIIDVDALITPAQARVIFDGQILGVTPLPGQEAQVAQALLGRGAHSECWRKGELPERFDFGTHRRVPAIVCMADIGWRYRSTQLAQYGGSSLGAHGYDPDAPEMAAIFLAHGPAFAEGVTLTKFRNVSVYPLLARLSDVAPEVNQGDLNDFNGALAH
jgi:predicted AlkP superfamily pyrophosphatase or phosphodiesterase